MNINKANVLNLGKNPTSTVLILAWPTILEQLVMSILNIADTAMVGTLGSASTAAVGIVLPLSWLLGGLCIAISTGFSVIVAQNIGADNMEKASKTASKAIFASFVLGAVITVISLIFAKNIPIWMGAKADSSFLSTQYFAILSISAAFNMCSTTCSSILRSCGKTKTPLFINSFAIILNVILNYLFIFKTRIIDIFGFKFQVWGAGLGVAGAAMGTVGAILVSFILLYRSLLKNDRGIAISKSDMPKFDRQIYGEACKIGIPIALERLTISLGQIAYMRIISTMGTAAVATHHLANQAESLSYLPCFGFSVASTTLVGQAVGAGDLKKAEHFGHIAARIGLIMSIISGSVLFFLGKPIINIFSNEAPIINAGAGLLKLIAFGQPFQAASIIYSGGIRGTGESKAPFFIGLSGIWGIRIVMCLILIFVFKMGLYAAWVAMLIDMTYRGYSTYRCYKNRFIAIQK